MLTVNNRPVPDAGSWQPSEPEMADRPRRHLTDSRAWELIRRKSGCKNAAEYQRLERDKRDAALGKALRRVDPTGVRTDGDQYWCDM